MGAERYKSGLTPAEEAVLDRLEPIARRMPELFIPHLWDRIRGDKERWRWLSIWNLSGDHPVPRARRAELYLWLSETKRGLELLQEARHPLAEAVKAKLTAFAAYQESDDDLYYLGIHLTERAEWLSEQPDSLSQEAAMLMFDARGVCYYYGHQNPVLALDSCTTALALARALGMRDKAKSLATQRNLCLRQLGQRIPKAETSRPSFDPLRDEYASQNAIKEHLLAGNYPESHRRAVLAFQGSSIPSFVRAAQHYSTGEYLKAAQELDALPTGKPEFRALWGALALQVIARLGSADLNARLVILEISRALDELRAPWETSRDMIRMFPLGAILASRSIQLRQHLQNAFEEAAVLRHDSIKDGIWWDSRLLVYPRRKGNRMTYSGVPNRVRELIYQGEAGYYQGTADPAQEQVLAGDYGIVGATDKSRWLAYLRHNRGRGMPAFTNLAAILFGLRRISEIRPRMTGFESAAMRFRLQHKSLRRITD